MSFYFPNVDPTFIFKRTGTNEDPYIFRQETHQINNSFITLLEIPNPVNKVIVKKLDNTTLTEVTSSTLLTNQYRVDYSTGIVYFHELLEGIKVTCDFYGMGMISFPSSRVWVDTNDGSSIKTLQQMFTDIDNLKTNWLTPVSTYANIATTYSNPKSGDTVQTTNDSKIYRFNGSVWVNTQQYTDNAITNFQNRLDGLSKVSNQYEWTTTAGQIVYILPPNSNLNDKWLEVTVGGATLPSSLIRIDSATQFTLLVSSTEIPEGIKVTATWVEPFIPATTGHKGTHEKGGFDEIDVTKLKNYQESIAVPLSNNVDGVSGDSTTVQSVLNNSMGKSIRIKKGFTPYIEVPSTNYPDLQSAIDDIQSKKIDRGSTLEIRLLSGIYDYASQVVLDSLNAPYVNIKGAEKISITTSGVYSITSSTFNIEYYSGDFKNLNYHKVTYNVSSVTGIQVGQFAIIKGTSGATNHELHQGVWEIITVDSVNNRITVLHTGHTPPPSSITANITIPKTVIRWLNNTTSLLADRNTTFGTIDNIVFVGTGRPETDISSGRSSSKWDMVGKTDGTGGVTGLIARDSSTLKLGSDFAITSFSGANIFATQSSQIDADNAVSSSSARQGFGSASGSSIQLSGSISSGNLLDGIIAQDVSFTFAKSAISYGNHRHGFISSGGGNVNADNGKAIGNRYSGAVAIASTISANSATLSNNGEHGLYVYNHGRSRAVGVITKSNSQYGIFAQTGSHITATNIDSSSNGTKDIYASDMSNILVTGYIGTPSIFPMVNALYIPDLSFIKYGTPTIGQITVNGTTVAGTYNANNHLLLGIDSEYTGLTGARLTVAGTSAFGGILYPSVDNTHNIGAASYRWSNIYAGTGTINTSDEREKQQIQPIDETVLKAWGKVQFTQFKFNDAVELKGDGARWHFGVIAQRVKEAFESEGLDPFGYGILCYDEWEDVYEDDENGDKVLVIPAGNRYGIRYEEALVLECAYLRSKINSI